MPPLSSFGVGATHEKTTLKFELNSRALRHNHGVVGIVVNMHAHERAVRAAIRTEKQHQGQHLAGYL